MRTQIAIIGAGIGGAAAALNLRHPARPTGPLQQWPGSLAMMR